MDKLRYNPSNPDLLIVRQAVFERLRKGGWGQEALVSEAALRAAFEPFIEFAEPSPPVPNWQRHFGEQIQEVLWQLVTEGVICPGGFTGYGMNFPWFRVTDYGTRILKSESAQPHDIERFLEQLKSKGSQVDPTVEAYLTESLLCLRQGLLVASSVLLGVAAERTFLMISDAMLEAIADKNERSALEKLLHRQPMKPKLDWVHGKLVELDGRRPRLQDYPESTPLMVTGIYDLIRQQRNDLGHPRDVPPRVARQQVESCLLLFAKFYGDAEQLRSYFAARKGSL